MAERQRTTVVSLVLALVALTVLASTGAGAGQIDRPAVRSEEVASSAAPNATAGLGASIVRGRQGETATLQVTLEATSEATIVVGGGEGGYNVTVTITDGNGDGAVPLKFRTDAVGMQATRFIPADDADEYGTLNASPDPDEVVPVGEYPIAVYAGHGVSGEPTDIGTLVVTNATPPEASITRNGSAVTLHAEPGQAIAGTADLDAGRNVTVRLRSSGESPFIKTARTTVGEGGAFSASFDLSRIDPPTNATATVRVDGERIAGPVEVDVVAQQSSTPGQPGFGIIAAVVALVGAIALERHHRG